jgi:hypothetical protein
VNDPHPAIPSQKIYNNGGLNKFWTSSKMDDSSFSAKLVAIKNTQQSGMAVTLNRIIFQDYYEFRPKFSSSILNSFMYCFQEAQSSLLCLTWTGNDIIRNTSRYFHNCSEEL